MTKFINQSLMLIVSGIGLVAIALGYLQQHDFLLTTFVLAGTYILLLGIQNELNPIH